MINIENDVEINENKPSVKNLRKSEKVVALFLEYYYKYIAPKDVKIDPFDTVLLKAHYSFSSHLLLTVFVLVTSHWFIDEPIVCVDRSDLSKAPDKLLDICASYPYVEYPLNNDRNKMVRRYAMHYRWVHIACLILAFVFKGVALMKKIFYFKKYREMLEEICKVKLHDRFWIAKKYFSNNIGCHKNMYSRFIYVHLSALLINIVCFAGLNITFQNEYWDLPKNLLIKRNPNTFHDEFSLIFPPFVKCEINPIHHILVLRHKYFGCHLPLMEIYEKIFMMFWFWQVFLGIWTFIFITYNIPLSFYLGWKRRLLIPGWFNHFEPYTTCAQNFTTDDVFALSSITSLVLGDEFARLLNHLIEIRKERNDSLDPNETSFNEASGNSTLFQSCFQEERKQHVPIGFEGLGSTPIPCTSTFNPVSSSTMHSTPENNFSDNYTAWKRSISLEFDMTCLNSISHNAKIEPLMKYLHRDIPIMKNPDGSTFIPSAPQDTLQGAPYDQLHKTSSGGEKKVDDIDKNWNNHDNNDDNDKNWDNNDDQHESDNKNENKVWNNNVNGWGEKEDLGNEEIEECWDNEERCDNTEYFGKRW